jgi:DNA-binding CsgD family transcriptional regulator
VKIVDRLAGRFGERYRLTPAETAVLAGLLAGRTPSELAVDRRCSPATVRVHIRSLHAKLGISRSMALLPLVMAELETLPAPLEEVEAPSAVDKLERA